MTTESKEQIIQILNAAGFEENGKDQYAHPKKGRLFLKTYEPSELVDKLMKLGAQHQCRDIRRALQINEDVIFEAGA